MKPKLSNFTLPIKIVRNFIKPLSTSSALSLSAPTTVKSSDSVIPRPKALPQPSLIAEHVYTEQHIELRESYQKLIQKEIEPYIDEWEAKGIFPAHELFKKLGDAGFLGISKPVEYGGMGLEYSYEIAAAEELGKCSCGAIPMAIGLYCCLFRFSGNPTFIYLNRRNSPRQNSPK